MKRVAGVDERLFCFVRGGFFFSFFFGKEGGGKMVGGGWTDHQEGPGCVIEEDGRGDDEHG